MDLSWIWRSAWESLPLPAIDWFWLDFAGYAFVILLGLFILGFLSRFLPDAVKPIVLAIATGGLTFLWGYYRRHKDQQRREERRRVSEPPPAPPPRNDQWFNWRQ